MDKLLKRWNDLAGINNPGAVDHSNLKKENGLQEAYGNSFINKILNEESMADKLNAAMDQKQDEDDQPEGTISDSEMIKKFKSSEMQALVKSIPATLNDEFQAVLKIASEVAADGDKSLMIKIIKKLESLSGKSAGMEFSKEKEEN